MPTRTEVLQQLRARDELQNRDLALLLDYLEEVAGASSGTRDTILSSRRRIQDEITPQDFERLYNYLAELGTPANTFAAFSRVLRRRDILSRQLANFVMDEIDGASFGPPGGAPRIWVDAQDLSTMWIERDGSRTTPVTASGQNVGEWLNKGDDSAFTDVDSFATFNTDIRRPYYRTDLTGGNGKPWVMFGSPDDDNVNLTSDVTFGPFTGPWTALVVFIRQGVDADAATASWWHADAAKSGDTQGRPGPSDFGTMSIDGQVSMTSAFSTQTISAMYAWSDGVSDTVAKATWEAVAGTDVAGTGLTGTASMRIGANILDNNGYFNGGIGELILWPERFGASDRAALEAYVTGRWGPTWAV